MQTFLDDLVAHKADAVALDDGTTTRTFSALRDRVHGLVGDLVAHHSTEPETTVAIFAHNCTEYFEIMSAATIAGMTYVPVNWHWSAAELAYVIDDAEPAVLFVERRLLDIATQALTAASFSPHLVLFGEGDESVDGAVELEEICAVSSEAKWEVRDPFGFPMFYTSGTTGRPKGVRNVMTAGGPSIQTLAQVYGERLELPGDGVTLLDGPVYHSAQWLFSFIPLVLGSTLYIRSSFDPQQTLAAIEAHRVTNVHLVPTQFVRLLRLDEGIRTHYDLSSLRCVYHGAAPCPRDVKAKMLDWWGEKIFEYYGATETGVVAMISGSQWRARPGSVGRPSPGVTVEILDEDGLALPPGQEGIVATKSSRAVAYHRDPSKTERALLGDGSFSVGDIGYLDAEGYLFISDRKIDMIISGGVNIYPAEIESVLHGFPGVVDAAVIGVPDEEFGEGVLALIQLGDDLVPSEETAEKLEQFCREHLAGYKVPRHIEFRPFLERSLAGKLLKRELRAPYWERVARKI